MNINCPYTCLRVPNNNNKCLIILQWKQATLKFYSGEGSTYTHDVGISPRGLVCLLPLHLSLWSSPKMQSSEVLVIFLHVVVVVVFVGSTQHNLCCLKWLLWSLPVKTNGLQHAMFCFVAVPTLVWWDTYVSRGRSPIKFLRIFYVSASLKLTWTIWGVY